MNIPFLSAKRAESKEQASYEALIVSCWDALWRYAYRATGNRDDAEDLLSETLLEGFKSFRQFRGETAFIRWMYRIMTTTHIDMTRRKSARKTESLDTPLSASDGENTAVREIVDAAANPETLVLAPMLSEPVQTALNALPEDFRRVVILADMEQLDYADVSRILQIPVGTVRSRLHRARILLRKALTNYVETPNDGA